MVKESTRGLENILPFLAVTRLAEELHTEEIFPSRLNWLHTAAFLPLLLFRVKFGLRGALASPVYERRLRGMEDYQDETV